MRIGVPKEIKTQEYRVGMTPAGVAMLTQRGHTVLVEQGAGLGSGILDEAFVKAGATIVDPITIPDLKALLATRTGSAEEEGRGGRGAVHCDPFR